MMLVMKRGVVAVLLVVCLGILGGVQAETVDTIECDVLIVGGTESGCAAAVQAARMGVQKIVIVNDIEWLGGQFSAEALMAIDENRGPAGYSEGGGTPASIPRHGAFKEVIDRIEALNLEKYGRSQPGNTRVSTTTRPRDAEQVFREWLAPYVTSGQIEIRSWYEPVKVDRDGDRLTGVQFKDTSGEHPNLVVRAKQTIDASDWGDVIRLSGADYEFGPDLKSTYQEPLAPESREGYPLTDMNPITYCMVIVETDDYTPIPEPKHYNPESYRHHNYPKDPLWLYPSRRLIDHYTFPEIDHPDVLLLCFPAFDYPVDVWTQSVAASLEASETGASKKNIVELTPTQRRIVFEDAKQYSLGFLYYLQTEVHDAMPDKTHSFRRFKLTDEFGTVDQMPFKPYPRESLRLKAMYMMRQQDTVGVGGNALHYAQAMYHDSIASWQFEYDFHPTKREFLDNGDTAGPWRSVFREGRTWGPPYSGLSLFSMRSVVPERVDGLLAAQKNLGFTSLIGSAVRLHDQSMSVGQGVGAVAAVAVIQNIQPREIPFNRRYVMAVQQGIASNRDGAEPGFVWPFRDIDSSEPAFTAITMLAVQGCLPLLANEVYFRPEDTPTEEWMDAVVALTREQLSDETKLPSPPKQARTRAAFALL